MKSTIPPHPLLDTLLQENNLKNDAALCRALRIQPANLSKIRHGVIPVSDYLRVKVMRHFHWTINRLDTVVPPAAAEQAGAVQ